MPTVIDDFVVRLGLDPSDYKKEIADYRADQRKQAEFDRQAGNEEKRRQHERADAIRDVKRETLSLFAVMVGSGSIASFAASQTRDLSQMDRAAKAAGVSVGNLAAFGNMVQRNGGDAATARASIAGLADELTRFKVTGQTAMLPALSRIGASRDDDALAVYAKFAKFAEGKNAPLVNYVGKQLGLDEASINLALRGQKAVNAELEKSKRLQAIDERQTAKVRELQDAFTGLRQRIAGVGQSLLFDLAPPLTGFLQWLDDILGKAPGVTKAVVGIGAALVGVGAAIKTYGLVSTVLGLGGGARAASTAGAVAGNAALGRGALALAGRASPIAAFLATVFTPTRANVGEDELAAKLNAEWKARGAKPRTDRPTLSAQDRTDAIRTIIGEAATQGAQGQEAVAAVILNRAKERGLTVSQVVRQKGQFEPWMTQAGRDRMNRPAVGSPAWKAAEAALDAAMLRDITNGADSFYAPKAQAALARRDGRPVKARFDDGTGVDIGDHRFFDANKPVRRGARGATVTPASASGSTSTVTIGSITVNTQATDAQGVAGALPGALRRQGLAVQAAPGLS